MNQPLDSAAQPVNTTPAMPAAIGISPDAIQNAIDASVARLKDTSNGREVNGAAALASNHAARAIEQASLRVAEAVGRPELGAGHAPATPGPAAPEQNILTQVLSPEALALLQGQATQPQVPQNAVTTPTPAPPAAPAPQPSAQELAIQQLAQAVAQQNALQQQQYQQALLAQQQQAQAYAMQQAQAWRDPSVRQRALEQAGLQPDDPSAQFMYQTYHQAQDEIGQMRAVMQQQTQTIQQLIGAFQGMQASAQQITVQSTIADQAGKELAAAPAPARDAVVQNALALVRAGLDPAKAYEQASAPLRAMLAAGARPAPTAPQVPADITAGIALRGATSSALQGLAPQPGRGVPSLNDIARSLPQLDLLVAQGLLRR